MSSILTESCRDATADAEMRYLVLGTAGHIDHGKTTLVGRLTGVDTDRLPEEKKRGITIDLGFADLQLPGVKFGIVDVPGHERFVHNMVSGATGIDIAMLVIAADDSVMPQTKEHLAILQLLGVTAGLVAITKIDLVDAEHLELVIEEVRELLEGTALADAPVVPVSSATGDGLESLREQLGTVAAAYSRPVRRQVFRLPIDRVFTVQGYGTIVTGTVLSGTLQVGDQLTLMPYGRGARIRGLQSHNSDLHRVHAGQRAAINLAGIKNDEVRRGDELTVGGYLEPSRRILTRVQMLATASKPLRDRQMVRLHVGTREITVRSILKGGNIKPGDDAIVEFRSRDWILADYGQRFILRQLSPVVTLGGGVILDPVIPARRRLRDLAAAGNKLDQPDPRARLDAYLEDHDVDELSPLALACRLGIDPSERESMIERLQKDRNLVRVGGSKGVLMHKARRETLGEQIVARCQRELRLRQPSRALDRATLARSARYLAAAPVVEAMIDDLLSRGLFVKVGDKIGPAGHRVKLTRNQQKWQDQLLEACKQGGLAPPVLGDLSKQIGQPIKEIETLARVAAEDGLLVRVAENLFVDPHALEDARQRIIENLRAKGKASVADLRDLWGVSRKYAVPLCEFFDALGVTIRVGDLRDLGPNADTSICAGKE